MSCNFALYSIKDIKPKSNYALIDKIIRFFTLQKIK